MTFTVTWLWDVFSNQKIFLLWKQSIIQSVPFAAGFLGIFLNFKSASVKFQERIAMQSEEDFNGTASQYRVSRTFIHAKIYLKRISIQVSPFFLPRAIRNKVTLLCNAQS